MIEKENEKLESENKNLKQRLNQYKRESRKSLVMSERLKLDKEDLIEFIREIDHKLSVIQVDVPDLKEFIRHRLIQDDPKYEREIRLKEK